MMSFENLRKINKKEFADAGNLYLPSLVISMMAVRIV